MFEIHSAISDKHWGYGKNSLYFVFMNIFSGKEIKKIKQSCASGLSFYRDSAAEVFGNTNDMLTWLIKKVPV